MSKYAMSARTLLVLAAIAACSDSPSTAPTPNRSLTIAPQAGTIYEQDVVTLVATVRDANGAPVPGATIQWSTNDPTRAEVGNGGVVTLLKPGNVTITARSGQLTASIVANVQPLTVLAVQVLPDSLRLGRGDITVVGVRAEGIGGRTILGRLVKITSDDPSIATIDAAGRVRAIAAGTTNVRATADGVSGTARITVLAADASLPLHQLNGARLPAFITGDSVTVFGVREYHEVFAEGGDLVLSTLGRPRYHVDVRYAEYNVRTVNGTKVYELRHTSREQDFGGVQYDARGDLLMTSEYISPLSHTAIPDAAGINVRFRVPGTDEYLNLMYRRGPE
ncbi:MAG: Ig-like domain-containing protein [Cytophagaceae bacterium]|nr:Ig-like domain-containing protein [Gemmatimonadaceae bacterium]